MKLLGSVLSTIVVAKDLGFTPLEDPTFEHFITRRHADNVDDIDWDDIRYTRCQADLFDKLGVQIPETHVHDFPDQECDVENEVGTAPNALDNTVRKWDQNFNQSTNKFEIAYCFDGSHSSDVQQTIKNKLDEFARDTCVALINTPSHDCRQGGKYQDRV